MIKPKALKKGDKIAIISPASSYESEALKRGIAALESLGLEVKQPESMTPHLGYLAGTDAERLNELQSAFTDKEIKGVFCTRGGYGTMRLISQLKPEVITQNPKVFVGYSDLSALLNLLTVHCSFITFHGPVVAKDLDLKTRPKTLSWLEKAVMNTEPMGQIEVKSGNGQDPATIYPGQARGILVGGNLCLMAASIGTPFEIQTDGKIFFLEEFSERPYRVDRLLQQLLLAKKFSRVSGVLLGEFVNCGEGQASSVKGSSQKGDIVEVIRDVLQHLEVPILYGFPAGHCEEKVTLPLGVKVEIDADRGMINVLEAGVV